MVFWCVSETGRSVLWLQTLLLGIAFDSSGCCQWGKSFVDNLSTTTKNKKHRRPVALLFRKLDESRRVLRNKVAKARKPKVHWHTYPKTPRMNAHAERFNRTIQEEFLLYHEELLVDPKQFNRPLIPWLLWFNADRPHWSLNLKSPVQFLTEKYPKECKIWWPNTLA